MAEEKFAVQGFRGIKLEKMYFYKYDDPDSKVGVMFNPTEVAIKQTVPWNAQPKPGKNTPKQQFTAGQARTMSLKLEFDTSGLTNPAPPGAGAPPAQAMDVRNAINPILVFAQVPEDEDVKYPPLIVCEWGQGISFTCVIKSANVTFTKFNPDGGPVRANMQLELFEAKPDEYNKFMQTNASSGSVVQANDGDTAHSMAGNQEDWRDTVDSNPETFPDGNPRSASAGPTQTAS